MADRAFDIRRLQDKLAIHLSLEWVYDTGESPATKTVAPGVIVNPGKAHLEELIRLGEIGYVRGIEAKLADLAKTDENGPFVAQARAFVQAFDLAGYTDFLHDITTKEQTRGPS